MLTTWQAPGGSEELALWLGQPGTPCLTEP